MNRLENKVAIVTGAAGGMGAAIAKLFATEGAKVMATDIQEEKLKEWVLAARKEGLPVEFETHDVCSEKDWQKVINKTVSLFGKINILINNAGVYPVGATSETTTTADWERIIGINATGPFTGSRLCVPYFRSAGGGSVVHISSIAGLVGGNGPAYTASKGALRLLTKDQAVELAKDNIRVNSIHPGGVLTPMTEFLISTPGSEDLLKNMCPLGRIGTAMEIAYGALYLASDEASYTTGAELVIDGGLTAR
ncbi:glucose 1-dehydrogenase [Agriterribacter sp.]|uniref:glucose 1-dehydrogenase n=1 Tax=Agriterribacter sp. TaxID=2821509 RepID=UPI002BA7A019|nr:glucose 1-dehydrogenase [Agriterribacter sp.]HRO47533.1 glucose 1-dehydrogenase [Agriterribacter sp.]HRQ17009.1 glucose 1-dehydrogenase [Agriterribacter sp.]